MKRLFVLSLVLVFCFSGSFSFAKTTQELYDGNIVVEYWGTGNNTNKEYRHIRVYVNKKWVENFGDDWQIYLVYKFPGVIFTRDADGNCMLPEGVRVRTKWHIFYYNKKGDKAGYQLFTINQENGLIPLCLGEEAKDLDNIVFFCCPYKSSFDEDISDYFTVVIAKKDATYKDVLAVLEQEGRSICNTGELM